MLSVISPTLALDEAARHLGWSRNTLKRRLERGRERLRIRLTRRGVTLGIGLFAAALTDRALSGAVATPCETPRCAPSLLFTSGESNMIAAACAALLAKEALRTMLITKFKLGAMLILMLGCTFTMAGLASQRMPEDTHRSDQAESPPSRPKAGDSRLAQDRHVGKDCHGDELPKRVLARLGTVRLRHKSTANAAVFTRDGKTAIVGDHSGDIVYWDVATGRVVRRLKAQGSVFSLAITADGKTLASGANDGLSLWDVATGKLISNYADVDRSALVQILFTPDGKTMALRFTNPRIYLWDVVRNKKLHELKGHTGDVQNMDFSPDGKTLASGGWKDPHIRLWDVATGKETRRILTRESDITRVAFSPDGKTLASNGDRFGLRFWDAASGKKLREAERNLLEDFAYFPDGKTLVAWEADRRLHFYDALTAKHLGKSEASPCQDDFLVLSADGKTAATVGGANTFDLWDIARGKRLHEFEGHRKEVNSLAFSVDGGTLFSSAGINGDGLRMWDVATGETRKTPRSIPSPVSGLSLSPDGKLMAVWTFGVGTIHFVDPMSGTERRSIKGEGKGQNAVAWSGDGKTLVCRNHSDRNIRLWEVGTGKQCLAIPMRLDQGHYVVLSPDGKLVAAGGFRDGSIHLWDAVNGKELPSLQTGQEWAPALAFSPDSSFLASGGRAGGICLWEPITGRLLHQCDAKSGGVEKLAFSQDGRTLVAGYNDGAVRLWEVVTGQERACFKGGGGSVLAVALTRDGRRIASGNADTTILVWDGTAGVHPDAALSAEQLQALWGDLIRTDAIRAYRAIWRLALLPKQALPFLMERLRPAAPLDASRRKQVERLLTDLDNEMFAVRQKAEAELEKMGSQLEPALRDALERNPSLEVRRRIKQVLASYSGERLRAVRALEALERMGTAQARRWIEELAQGESRAWLTREAKSARKRLAP